MAYQSPKVGDEPVDVRKMSYNRKESSVRHKRTGKEYQQESPELQTHGNSKNLVQRYLPKHADLDKTEDNIEERIKCNAFPHYGEGDPGRMLNQSILQ